METKTIRQLIFFILLCTLIASASTQAGVVIRRDGLGEIQGPIVAIDDAGVTLRHNGTTALIVWDHIRGIEPDEAMPFLDERLEFAEALWRARRRLTRGDMKLAEPIFERLFEQTRGRTNETALITAEGLLRCRLMRGANETAVIPFLEMARVRRSGITTDRYANLRPVYDEGYALCPQLAPFWADKKAQKRLAVDLQAYEPGDDPVIEAIQELYLHFIEGQINSKQKDDSTRYPRHQGVELLRRLAEVGIGDENQRLAGRKRLIRELENHPEWAESWIRYQLGIVLLKEENRDSQEQGLVSLSNLPARFSVNQPYLAGMALWHMVKHIESGGSQMNAATLRSELLRLYPGHPALFTNTTTEVLPEKAKESL